MRDAIDRLRTPLFSSGAALLAGLLLAACLPRAEGVEAPNERPTAAPTGASRGGEETLIEARWREVDRLISEQKLEAAAARTAEIVAAASEAGREEEWARALVRTVQVRTALHGYATAVKWLRSSPWPESPRERALLHLFYAQGLVTYRQAYSWEIAQRERVASGEDVELERWTAAQIDAEAERAYSEVWSERAEWGSEGLGRFAEYLEQNNYPARIRGTLRDAVTYLWVDLLADTSRWRPEQSRGLYRLELAELIAGDPDAAAGLDLADVAIHPLVRMGALLADLEAWHRAGEHPEAAFEARLERLRRLHDAFDRAADREAIRADLEGRLEELGRRFEWWAVGMAELAGFVRDDEGPDPLVRAREIALAGEAAHPGTIGGERCRYLVAQIEAPSFSLAGMASDGAGRRSLAVEHKNLESLHLRAYALDLDRVLSGSEDYDLLPGYRQVPTILEERRADAEWRVDLPPTPDYSSHTTYLVPPLTAPGLYVVAASADEDFSERRNRRSAVNFLLGDLVLLTRPLEGGLEVTVRSGASGEPLAGAEVELYRYDYQNGHQRVEGRTSGPDGAVRFERTNKDRASYFLVARRGGEIALDPSSRWFRRHRARREETSALVYTDRSVYRPLQEVLWKVVGYGSGGAIGRWTTLPGTDLVVELVDANGEVVASRAARTNGFGSASGAFSIPAGRLLGSWHLRTSLGGSAVVAVEEYKRPTFEVTIRRPAAELRLNRPAELTGEVRYYFGLPVTAGEVAWRVTREPVYPWWWGWWAPRPRAGTEILASGDAELDAGGLFRVEFLPQADERDAETPGMSYRFRLAADVTDEGGETRSAERSFRLGFVTVEAAIESESGFFRAAVRPELEVVRRDLDGTPRAGSGGWRLTELAQPEAALLPAEQPLPEPAGGDSEGPYRTPGDRLRPRWAPEYSPQQVLSAWPDGPEVAAGELVHGDDGRSPVPLPNLVPGAYRLHYRTVDEFGAVFETRRELVVAAAGATPLALPAFLALERSSVPVGGVARLLVHSGLAGQELMLDTYRDGERIDRRRLASGDGAQVVEIPVTVRERGGLGFRLTGVRDHQLLSLSQALFVPWDDRRLTVELESFRDKLRPGSRETWTVRVSGADEAALGRGAAELLAYMYDRSLDIFAPHAPVDPLALYPLRSAVGRLDASLGGVGESWSSARGFADLPEYPHLHGDRLKFFDGYPIGGPGVRRGDVVFAMAEAQGPMPMERRELAAEVAPPRPRKVPIPDPTPEAVAEAAPPGEEASEGLRTDFAETAFFEPHLLLGEDGTVSFEFAVPDSVTEWSVWVHALTRDLAAGRLETRARSVKDLLVRPYLPRFLREGDRAAIKVLVNNAGEVELSGTLDFEVFEPAGGDSLAAAFGLAAEEVAAVPFTVAPGAGAELTFALTTPTRVGEVAFRVRARAGGLADGEQRSLPVLPGRMHLVQSRFATLRGAERRELSFADLAADDDPSRIDERLVVTLDAQLFYSVLNALPYLVDYPYECTEQTLNRFLSTGIAASLYDEYPAVARMAEKLAARETPLEPWAAEDANRKMALEETPWLVAARGGEEPEEGLVNVLDPRIARAQREAALAKLAKAQTSLGGFPWWPGGPPSPYMTLYLLNGFSRALEFGVEVPREMVADAWRYMHRHWVDEVADEMVVDDCCWEMVTFLNYVLSAYPDPSWTEGVFGADERRRMLDFSFHHWREHAPLLKGYLALTLARAGRAADATLVWDSVMDSARTTEDEGTFWAPEERAWLWYNDTVESHAFALRTLSELDPGDARRHGLVQWLLLNKKLNHWKSTRATAEVIYALAHYLDREGTLAAREEVEVAIGPRSETFVFEPDEYTGRNNQVIVAGEEVDPRTDATIVVEKETPGFLFASATWHYSTEKLPEEARGDFFSVERSYFLRRSEGDEWVLRPLGEAAGLEVGDQLEVHLAIRAKHAAEYVHLRDPRPAGFEPETTASRYRWDLGIGWYEEVRDSGTNFFFEWLPAGEYTFKYRLRANLGGTFKAAPAQLQSMYAPEFAAFSAGDLVEIGAD